MLIKKIKLGLKTFSKINNWWFYFLDYLGMKEGKIIYKIGKNKIKTRAGTIDKSILTEIILTEKYFPKWLKLKKNPIIIDLGAHIGIFSVLINSKFPTSQVYAIEPEKNNFNLFYHDFIV